MVTSHDYVFWCGDFNYRIDMTGPEVKRLVNERNWLDLQRFDQLTTQRLSGTVFREFEEGPIRFAPTYKYDQFCDDYDTSEKARSPAWTDRILWRRWRAWFPRIEVDGSATKLAEIKSTPIEIDWSPGRLLVYNRAELKTSDHRPVGAIMDIDISVVRLTRWPDFSTMPCDCSAKLLVLE
ncbi:unnamed protein product [Protopolystoma xenopodis]|uniref:Inositol polyphosphate-related phosphatase domain-containing protein n=1 Tax=Protopolystoma xenopodis TaxID=117903 RepID=A0A3S5AB76_9PLAT|nr:unnamed protein product [Protopolystoma xenopodis]